MNLRILGSVWMSLRIHHNWIISKRFNLTWPRKFLRKLRNQIFQMSYFFLLGQTLLRKNRSQTCLQSFVQGFSWSLGRINSQRMIVIVLELRLENFLFWRKFSKMNHNRMFWHFLLSCQKLWETIDSWISSCVFLLLFCWRMFS